MDGKMHDVLIIGAGPTGLTLAINLLRNGINCKIIDKRQTHKSSESKAITVNAATLKLYHNIGVIDKFLELGCIVNDIYVHWNGRKLMHVNYRHLVSPYKYFLSIPQPESEEILLQYFLDLGGLVNFDTELINIDYSNPQLIKAKVLNHGIMNNHVSQYLVGCDGAKSKLREMMGSEFMGRDYGIFFELIDVHLEWSGNKDATHYFVVENCFIIIIPMTDNKHRIVIKNNIIDLEQIRTEKPSSYYEDIIHQCGVAKLTIKSIVWRSFSRFYNRLIDHYNHGDRIFFAGDACHLFSPIGGLGMNTGVQDAFNLSWRLSYVLLGKSDPKILRVYNYERRHIGSKLIQSTDASTELIIRHNKKGSAIANWLPIMQNRKNMKHALPLNFSGLSHNYTLNGKEIYHVPFARGINISANKEICTYDIVDGIHFNVFLFTNQIVAADPFLTQRLLKYNKIKIWQITNTPEGVNTLISQDNVCVIFDKYDEFYGKHEICHEGIVVIRPDGYVGLTTKMHEISTLKSYLNDYVAVSDDKLKVTKL